MLRAAVKSSSMYLLLWPASDATESPAPDATKGKGSKSYRGIAWRVEGGGGGGDGSGGDARRDAVESGGDGREVSLNAR